jgi:anthraniloyl-CoA monooxygenase
VVLLGDALHTAHFSIGSGTKLALEDAIALAGAFAGQEEGGVEGALDRFEAARKPVVDAIQEAAYESLLRFERMEEDMTLEPLPFAYRLMTRSGRIDHEKLRQRDPDFVAAYESAVR